MRNRERYISKIVNAILLTLIVCFGLSCSKRPSYVLPEGKMIDLMVDMELAEAYSNNQPGGRTTDAKKELGRRVMATHNVTPEQLDTTLAWYGRNLDEYSALFDKIDKEINKRRELYIETDEIKTDDSENLWPYSRHLVISPLSGYESLLISLDRPAVEKGERLKLSFSLPNIYGMKGVLGVEYSDGTSEAAISTFNGKPKIEMEVQTDTGKLIDRLYGVISLKETVNQPVYIDSLLISRIPYDSTEYLSKRRSQKKYGIIQERPKPVIKKDTVESDSIPVDTIQSKNIEAPEVKNKNAANKPKKPETKTTTPVSIKKSQDNTKKGSDNRPKPKRVS